MEEVVNATKNVQSEHPIINPENILLAGLYWSPVVDGILFKEQPARLLSDGKYDTSKNVVAGIVENEAEVNFCPVFGHHDIIVTILVFYSRIIQRTNWERGLCCDYFGSLSRHRNNNPDFVAISATLSTKTKTWRQKGM